MPRLGLYTSEAAECFLYDVRISNTARYTTEYGFDLPTEPFESDSNTMALVCTGNMLKDYGLSNSHAVTTNSSGT